MVAGEAGGPALALWAGQEGGELAGDVSIGRCVGLLLLGLAVEAELYSQLATMIIVALWFFDQAVLVRWADGRKEEAAAIQEDFDCVVLDLPWPEHSGVERPTDDRVKELVRMSGGRESRKKLADWYSEDDIPLEATAARLYCQTTNCRWDGRLRKEWICAVMSVVGASAGVSLIVAALAGVSLLEGGTCDRGSTQACRVVGD